MGESIMESLKMGFIFNMRDNENNKYTFIINSLVMVLLNFILNNDAVYDYIKSFFEVINKRCNFYSCKTIIIEGKRCLKTSDYMTRTDSLFSDRFLAFWHYIANNNLNNQSIKCLKEFADSSNIFDDNGDSKNSRRSIRLLNNNSNTSRDIFIVNQHQSFKINNDIYCKVLIDIEKLDDKKNSTIESIKVELYSYTLSLKNIRNFIDNLNIQYKYELEKIRQNKKYIYTLIGSGSSNNNNYDVEIINSWEECEFNSTRNFQNLFFDQKKLLINKLNFFENNRQWYEYEGHPYTFGIGLYGPPGTGKTSIIKCIANKLNRHIIVIPLNKIKTQTEFSQYFFEDRYNRNNTNNIGFEDKIIVFEDIDCMTNIVKKRKSNESDSDTYSDGGDLSKNNENNENNENNKNNKNFIIQNKLLNKIAKKIDEDHDDSMIINLDKDKNDKITLSFILNIIDGIRETPGRILIITSNNYNSLDPALIRPGRIDMTLEMRNTSVDGIKEMYNHYYNDIIPEDIANKLRDYLVSPAKIVNLRLEHENKNNFLNALVNEFK